MRRGARCGPPRRLLARLREHRSAGRRRRALNGITARSAFHAAQVVDARDDLLARVAALVERDRAELVEVQHLRDEPLRRLRRDLGNAELDLGERCRRFGCLGERSGERLKRAPARRALASTFRRRGRSKGRRGRTRRFGAVSPRCRAKRAPGSHRRGAPRRRRRRRGRPRPWSAARTCAAS